MPRRPQRPCAEPGCPNLTDKARCIEHRISYPQHDKRSNNRYSNPEYRRNRTKALKRDKHCRFQGCTQTQGLTVHHIVAIRDGGTHDLDNLVTLCDPHHRFVERQGRGTTT